jgi:adenine phosphoribosyltransferase
MKIKEYINEVPNFPIKDVNFKDISPLLANHEIFKEVIGDMGRMVKNPDYWVGVDARGFIFASALSIVYGGGVVLCRKKGKLPPPVRTYGYKTEYSSDVLEIKEGEGTVTIVDDVLATGGTMHTVNKLVENAGYTIENNLVLIDLKYVPRINNFDLEVKSLVDYE